MSRFKIPCYSVLAVFMLMAWGCAPSATQKPDVPPAGTATGPGASSGKGAPIPGEVRSGPATGDPASKSASSLDQLKEGKRPVTAATSPLKDVLFDYDSYDLKGDARDILRANAEWLKSNPSARIEVEGHCDERGTSEYNLALGAKRAQAVKDYLVSLGISVDRVSTISYGEEIPVCTEANENCWRQNRRARSVIIPARPAS